MASAIDAQLNAMAAEINRKGAKAIDNETTLTNVEARPGKTLVYKYTLAVAKADMPPGALIQNIRPKLLDAYQHNHEMSFFRDNGVSVIYHYEDKAGEVIDEISIGPKDLSLLRRVASATLG